MSKFHSPEQYLGLSCLAVGAGAGGSIQMLARATVIDYWGNVLFDSFVKPTEPVINYKTAHTGIEEKHLSGSGAKSFEVVQAEVNRLISSRIIIGHSLWTDLAVLGISHQAVNTRDTALYMPFRIALKQPNQILGLSTLVWSLMKRRIQSGFINSVSAAGQSLVSDWQTDRAQVENARASIDIFRSVQDSWETHIFNDEWPCALPPAAYAQYIF